MTHARRFARTRRTIGFLLLPTLVGIVLFVASTGNAPAQGPRPVPAVRHTPDVAPPTKPMHLAKPSATKTSLSLTWTAATDNLGVAGYTVYLGGTKVATTTSTRHTVPKLECGKRYTLAIDAYDAARNHSARARATMWTSRCWVPSPATLTRLATTLYRGDTSVGTVQIPGQLVSGRVCPPPDAGGLWVDPFCHDRFPPTQPTGLAKTAATATSLSVVWDASFDDVGVAGYTVLVNGDQVGTTAATSFTVSGLSCWTGYSVAVDAFDAAGNHSAQAVLSAATSGCADTTAPSAPGGLVKTGSTLTSVSVGWAASTDDVGVAGYTVFVNGAPVGTTPATSYTVGGLLCGLLYMVAVDAYDAAGNHSARSSISVLAAACPDTTPPTVSITGPAAGATVSGTVSVVASASDDVAVGSVEFWIDGVNRATDATAPYSYDWDTTVEGNGSHTILVKAFDSSGNSAVASMTVTASNAENTPPTQPTGLAQTGSTANSLSLRWTASTDDVGVAGYTVFVNGARVGTTTATSYTVGGLTCATTYTLGVDAYDAAGNHSPTSSISASTAACPDTDAPSAPVTLTATPVSGTRIDLSWGAATDNVGVSSYRIERCQGAGCSSFGLIAAPAGTGTSFSDTTVAANTSYSYRVRAADAAGNLGPYGNTASATTTTSSPIPVGAYGFDQGSGTTVTDDSGNGNTGTLANATWVTPGRYGKALSFDGSSARVTVPDSPSLHLTTAMTAEAWVNPSAVTSSWRDVIEKGNDDYYLEATSPNRGYPAGRAVAGVTAYGTAMLAVDTWTHLALTYDGSAVRLYVNGTLVTTTAKTGTINTSTGPLTIGSDPIYGQYFSGMIDDVRIYNTALTPTQIQTDMATPVTGGTPATDQTPPSGPTALAAIAATADSISLNWTAATDDRAVTGYTVYVNNSKVGTTAATTYTASGLSCATGYTLSVDAYDAAGNHSSQASVNATTSACSGESGPGTANVPLSANGSDSGGNCKRAPSPIPFPADPTSACRTFAKAYRLAQPGDEILVVAGTYQGETLPYTDGKADNLGHCDWSVNNSLTNPVGDYSGCITFEPVSGASVTVNNLKIDVPYVRVRGMTFHQLDIGSNSPYSTGLGTCSQYKQHDIIADGITVTDGSWHLQASHSALMNSTVDYGTAHAGHEKTAQIGQCLEVNGTTPSQRSWMAVIHNRIQNLIQDRADGTHMEAIHGEGGQHVLLARNTFYNNAGHNLSAQCGVYHDNCADWLIQNNFFDRICSHQPTTAQGGTCTIQGGDGFSCSGGHSRIDASIEFNTFLNHTPEYLLQDLSCTMTGTMIESGNLAESLYSDFHCSLYSTGSNGNPANSHILINNYNVWYQPALGSPNPISQCGATNRVGGPAAFVNPGAGDLHITAASSANNVVVPGSVTGGCPLLDIDGQARPQDTNCDAGADEVDSSPSANGLLGSDPNFFPITTWLQTPEFNATNYKNIGVNIFSGLFNGPSTANLSALQTAGEGVLINQQAAALSPTFSAYTSTMKGWLQMDEPDDAQPDGSGGYLPCIDPATIVATYNTMRAADASRPVILNFGPGAAYTNWPGRGTCTGHTEMYPQYARGADILSFDIYPVNDGYPITDVADGVDNLLTWGGGKPVWAFIETTPFRTGHTAPTVAQIKDEVWLALTHGATGIQYFCHILSPSFVEAGCLSDSAVKNAMQSVNTQIASLAPVLNSPTISGSVSISSTNRLDKIIKKYSGKTYIFATSPSGSNNNVVFTMTGFGDGTVTVIDESRTLNMINGRFQDIFSNYGTHLYRIDGTGAG